MWAWIRACVLIACCVASGSLLKVSSSSSSSSEVLIATPCTCGVFLSGDLSRGSAEGPRGNPALTHEHPDPLPCTPLGVKHCTNRCLELIVKHLPNSATIVCGTIDRDCHKERAYLFIKNCNDTWLNTRLSAGREFCCKDGAPYKCPPV